MGSRISIEIGAHSIRAAIMTGGNIYRVPLGFPSSPYSCPAVAVELDEGNFLYGDYAKNWIYCKPQNFCHIADVQPASELYASLYKGLASFILERLERCGWDHPSSCTIVIPAYFSTVDPRKNRIESSFKSAGIEKVTFIPDIVAQCNYKASIEENAAALAFDCGYSGTTVSVLRRCGSSIKLLSSVRNMDFGGRALDGVLMEKVSKMSSYHAAESFLSRILLMNSQAESVEHVREELSFYESVSQSVITGSGSFERIEFYNSFKDMCSKAVMASKAVIDNAGVSLSELSAAFICGGCSEMPLVEDVVKAYLAGQCDRPVKLEHLSNGIEYIWYPCYGAFYSNEDNVTITL